MDNKQLRLIIESLIFASDTPLSIRQISAIIKDADKSDIEKAIQTLEDDLDDRAFFLNKVVNGYQFATKPEFSKWISEMQDSKARSRLSRAALETLAIIAFKQPISRIEVSAIRGVNSDGVIKGLLERKLITISGRDKEHGRALLFNTTNEFLQYFNLNDISDLPRPKEIEELLAAGEGSNLLNTLPDEVMVTDEEPEEEFTAEPSEIQNESVKEDEKNIGSGIRDGNDGKGEKPAKSPEGNESEKQPAAKNDASE
ncbi:SMC-Scp complex subunit ScpB [candidate division KSB1 bacterium]|nr:SMC-Scp complex subunit ScpB [candidate division KSB1 bacterium]